MSLLAIHTKCVSTFAVTSIILLSQLIPTNQAFCKWSAWMQKKYFWDGNSCYRGHIRECRCRQYVWNDWYPALKTKCRNLQSPQVNSEFDVRRYSAKKAEYEFNCPTFRYYWGSWSSWTFPFQFQCGVRQYEKRSRKCKVLYRFQSISSVTKLGCDASSSASNRSSVYKPGQLIRKSRGSSEEEKCYFREECDDDYDDEEEEEPLSSGAIIGISFGSILGIIILVFCLVVCCSSDDKKAKNQANQGTVLFVPPELPGGAANPAGIEPTAQITLPPPLPGMSGVDDVLKQRDAQPEAAVSSSYPPTNTTTTTTFANVHFESASPPSYPAGNPQVQAVAPIGFTANACAGDAMATPLLYAVPATDAPAIPSQHENNDQPA